ncbi:MAG TPA: GMC family oxidoreductase [Steroidobacteraceae bacterium]|nr:GMC family oxidoreductase [Steroidobacteraceae bacterium]
MTLAALDLIEDSALETRVCIIGAGAAGITLASELDGCGFKVLLLEAGGLKPDANLDDYYRGSATNPHPDPTQFRRVMFGGTTGIWGGRCIPFDPIDLQRREHVADSGWPIRYEALAKFYPKAMQYCDAGSFDFTLAGSLPAPAPTIDGFDGTGPDGEKIVMTDQIERYSLPTDFGRCYRPRIHASKNVTALLGARCLRLVRRAGGERIEAAEVVDRAGRRRRVRADVFVLAMGGIEVPRLLMLSDPDGAGLGNLSDCLGRHYMCHFENTCGRIVPHGAAVAFDFERTADGVYCRRQLRFTPDAMQHHRLLNTAFRLHFPSYSDATHGSSVMSTIYLAKSTMIPEYRAIFAANAESPASPQLAHLRNVLTGLPQLMRFTADWLFRIRLAHRKLPYTLVPNADGTYPLEFNSEQTPQPENRVTLSEDVDRHGLRRVHIAWRISDADADAAYRAHVLLRDTVNRRGVCRLEFDETRLRERIGRSLPLGGHHMGTARMAASERGGVVDENCGVFGVRNLYVASSAVFPTSSHANPTLTIVALAVRLAEHLRVRIGGR